MKQFEAVVRHVSMKSLLFIDTEKFPRYTVK